MNKEKIYILQKDLPDLKAGAEFRWELFNGVEHLYSSSHYSFAQSFILSKPDWFKLKEEEKPRVTRSNYDEESVFFYINDKGPSIKVDKERLAEILIAEEKGEVLLYKDWNVVTPQQVLTKDLYEQEHGVKLFTEKEMVEAKEKAFNAGRSVYPHKYSLVETTKDLRYKTFSDYINR